MSDVFFMKEALKEASKAYVKGEVPVGAVIVKDNKIIARAHNLREVKQLSLAHAEILAIEKACRKLKSWRLDDCDLYVTLEPCLMCAGNIIQSRIGRVVYGTKDPKNGAHTSKTQAFDIRFNHKVEVHSGVLAKESSDLLKKFFIALRKGKDVV